LSEKQFIDSEQAFDMLPYVADIYEKIDLDCYRKKISNENKGNTDIDQQQVGIDAIKYVLKNSSKVKEEFFNIVAIADLKSIEEVKKQSFIKTIQSIKNIFSDPELVDFFKQAMQ
jgi:uncharacterized protein YwgA